LLLVIGVLIILLTHSWYHTHTTLVTAYGTTHETGFNVSASGVFLQTVIVIVYGTIMCGSRAGQTLGMMVVGCQVVDMTYGRPIGFGRAFGRALFEYLMVAFIFLPWVIDMLFPLWDPKKQTLHDKVTRAIVIKI
jgi:uncharacterized RDD family membrane protein YckC